MEKKSQTKNLKSTTYGGLVKIRALITLLDLLMKNGFIITVSLFYKDLIKEEKIL